MCLTEYNDPKYLTDQNYQYLPSWGMGWRGRGYTCQEAHEEDPGEGEYAGPQQGNADHPPGLGQVGEHPLTHLTDIQQGGQPGHGHRQVSLRRKDRVVSRVPVTFRLINMKQD